MRKLASDGWGESGQALVESALVIPLLVFLILGIIQLALIQHGRIMTDYAAYCAARTGIVWNANGTKMETAAIAALIPTMDTIVRKKESLTNPIAFIQRIVERVAVFQASRGAGQMIGLIQRGLGNQGAVPQPNGGAYQLGGAGQNFQASVDGAARAAVESGASVLARGVVGGGQERLVRVDVIRPPVGSSAAAALGILARSALGVGTGFSLGGAGGDFSGGGEIDFDTFAPGNSSFSDGTRLTIGVRYHYLLRIPFANWIIHSTWRAFRRGRALVAAIWSPQRRPGSTGLSGRGGGQEPPTGDPVTDTADMVFVDKLADQGIYLLPLYATYSMRMQSNPYRLGAFGR